MRGIKRTVAIITSLILVICLLAGCGATINTKMSFDKSFAGQRQIDVRIASSDLSEVSGGITSLQSIADANIPEGMTYTVSSDGDNTVMTFVIAFNGLEDYRNKVSAIINKGDAESEPSIYYEDLDTVFKKGIKFNENFTSFDLLNWYFNALKTANIINSDSSNWYELGDSTVIIDGTEYETNSQMNVEEQELCCLDRICVYTYFNIDGSFKRVITFSAEEDTVNELKNKDCELDKYLKKLISKDDILETSQEDGNYLFTVTLNAKDAKELVKKTDSVLQTKNSFSCVITENGKNDGKAKVKITEKLDGSYYLDYDSSSPLESTFYLFDNIEIVDNDEDYDFDYNQLTYYPNATNETVFDFNWKISFASVQINADFHGKDSSSIDFVFTSEKSLDDKLKNSAVKSLQKACEKHGKFKESDGSCTVSFSGKTKDVIKEINKFLCGNGKSEDANYFSISLFDGETNSKLTKSICGEISYDLSNIIGNTQVTFNDKEGFLKACYYDGDFTIDEDGNKTSSSTNTITIILIKPSLLNLILFILFLAFAICGIILLLINRKSLVNIIKNFKISKLNKSKAEQLTGSTVVNEFDIEDEFQEEQETVKEFAVVSEKKNNDIPAPPIDNTLQTDDDTEEFI